MIDRGGTEALSRGRSNQANAIMAGRDVQRRYPVGWREETAAGESGKERRSGDLASAWRIHVVALQVSSTFNGLMSLKAQRVVMKTSRALHL